MLVTEKKFHYVEMSSSFFMKIVTEKFKNYDKNVTYFLAFV